MTDKKAKRRAYYEANRERFAEQNRLRYLKNREKRLADRKAKYEQDKEAAKKAAKKWYWANQDRARKNRKAYYAAHRTELIGHVTKRRKKVRDAVRAFLGNKCACCGEAGRDFLTLDHIDGSGALHRRNMAHRASKNDPAYEEVYRAIKHEKPATNYQLLCFNCNMSKHFGKGVCFHRRAVENNPEFPYRSLAATGCG